MSAPSEHELRRKLAETRKLFQKAIAKGAVSQQQEYIRHIMEYSRRIQALERRNKELVEDLSEARHKIHDLERTEEPAEPVDLCGMPECCAPVDPASVLFYCTQHQSNYDSWTKDD